MQSTLILSKTDGSIIRSTGLLSSSPSPLPASNLGGSASGAYSSQANPGPDMDTADENRNVVTDYGDKSDGVVQTAEDVAKMVYSFVSVAGGLVEGLNKGDEVKLLRLRTKRNELVIVPGWSCAIPKCLRAKLDEFVGHLAC